MKMDRKLRFILKEQKRTLRQVAHIPVLDLGELRRNQMMLRTGPCTQSQRSDIDISDLLKTQTMKNRSFNLPRNHRDVRDLVYRRPSTSASVTTDVRFFSKPRPLSPSTLEPPRGLQILPCIGDTHLGSQKHQLSRTWDPPSDINFTIKKKEIPPASAGSSGTPSPTSTALPISTSGSDTSLPESLPRSPDSDGASREYCRQYLEKQNRLEVKKSCPKGDAEDKVKVISPPIKVIVRHISLRDDGGRKSRHNVLTRKVRR